MCGRIQAGKARENNHGSRHQFLNKLTELGEGWGASTSLASLACSGGKRRGRTGLSKKVRGVDAYRPGKGYWDCSIRNLELVDRP